MKNKQAMAGVYETDARRFEKKIPNLRESVSSSSIMYNSKSPVRMSYLPLARAGFSIPALRQKKYAQGPDFSLPPDARWPRAGMENLPRAEFSIPARGQV